MSSDKYSNWLRANQDKRGTSDYQTVLRAFQEAVAEEASLAATPPAPTPQPQSGFMPALRSGIQGLMGAGAALAGRTGLMDMAEAEKAVEARRQRQAEIFKPTEEWGLTKLSELLGGSVPYMAAPLAAAGAAAALPVTGAAAVATGLGAAGLASATQFTGTNLSRQIEEGKKLAETDLGNAALAAVPMALLDTLALRMLPGVGKLLGDAGIKVTKESAKEVSEQILKKAAIDYAAATGRAMTVEGLTEAAQQGFERLQAGLSITDADARKEYFDALVGGALVGGAIAPAGRMMERGKAKREIAAIEQEEAQQQAAAAREEESKRRQDPDYLEGLNKTYQDLLAQKNALEAQIKKGSEKAPLSQEDEDANAVIDRQLAELKQPLKRAQQAFIDAGGPQALAKLRAEQPALPPPPAQLELTPPPGRVSEPTAAEPEEAPETPEAQRARLTRDMKGLGDLLKQHRADLKAAKTPEEAAEAAAQVQKTNSAFMAAAKQFDALPKPPDVAKLQAREAGLVQSLADAQKKGKYATVLQIVPELQQVRAQLQEAQPTDLASEPYAAGEDRKRAELGEAMGAGREDVAGNRQLTELEQQAAREEDARNAQRQQQLDFEGWAESEVARERAEEAERQASLEATERLREAPQLDMFPEARQRVERRQVEVPVNERPMAVGRLRAELAKLLRDKRALEREAAQARSAPGAELSGPASLFVVNTQERMRALDTRIAEIEEELTALTAPAVETRTTALRPDEPQPDTRQIPLQQRLNTLAERVLASPRVDEDTKALVREVQDNLPLLMQRDPVAQRTLGRRGAMQAGVADASSVGAWLYRTLQGTAPDDLTQNVRDRLAELEAGRRSDTEPITQYAGRALTPEEKQQLEGTSLDYQRTRSAYTPIKRQGVMTREPTGEVRRAVQEEIPGVEPKPPQTPPPLPAATGETQAQREARTGQERAAEQARLEREQAQPAERIEFVRDTETDISRDPNYRVLLEKVDMASTREERAAAKKAAEDYFNARANKLTKDVKEAVRTASGHLEDLQKAKDRLKRLQERLKDNVTEKGRKMTPLQRAKVERDIEKEKGVIETHQKNYTNSASEVRVKRTDIKAEREAKQQLLADVQSRIEAGERLGEVEGTTAGRAIGPVTRPEVYPPKTMRTGSEESRTGVTTTDARSRLTEARGAKQRDIPMTAKEMKEAQAAASKMKTLEGLEKAEKALAAEREAASARGLKPGEFDRFEAREAVLKARRAALEKTVPAPAPAATTPAAAEVKPTAPVAEPAAAEAAEQRKRAQEANKIAQELAKKPAKQKAKESQAEAAVQREQAELRAAPASAAEEMEEELDAFEPEILPGTDEDVFFSRGETDAPSTTASVRAELGKVFPDTGRVQVYDSVDALIAANPQYKGMIPSDARGFVDSAGNKAFLIAENINKGQSLSVLLHEVGAHIGLKNMLGEAQYNALVNAVKAWEKKADGSVESRVAKAARERVEAAETKASQVDDELLAYAVEEAVNAGVKPMETKGVLGQWLGRVAQLFRRALEKFGLPPKSLDAQGLVDMAFGAAKLEMRGGGTPPRGGGKPAGDLLFSRNLPTASRVANQLVAEQPTWLDKLKANFLGTGFRTQFIDKLDPVEKALKQGKVEELKAAQALFYLRMYDQRMHYTSQAVYEGAPAIVEKTRRDGRTERMVEAQPGANLKQVADIMLKPAVVKAAGSADAANKLFTLYLAAIRGTRVGFDKLNFGHAWATAEIARIESQLESSTLSPEMRSNLQKKRASLEKRLASMPTEADIKAAKAEIDADPVLSGAFQEARDVYNAYNRNLMQFAIDTGAIGQERGAKLLASNDYIPYYRMRDGVAELMIGSEPPIRIGNLKDSPHLQELVGGDEAIFDFMTSSVQNTSLLIDMSMRNLATKNLMFELRDVGLAKISKVKGGNAPTGSVTFQKDGDEYFAVVDTDALGIDSELLVKGLAGIPTMFPTFVRLFGIPARLLRRLVVISPVYMARQLVRDTTAAAIASGANITPVVSALRQIGKDSVLERRGITGGMVFTGMPEDQARLLKDMQTGKLSIASGMARMEALSAKVDALAREAQYESYREQGLSEMEATLMALESMNFSRRGLSPTMHMVSTLIPFFNAQVQGLDVLYRSFRGDMPFNERLQVREKLWKRGMFLFGMSMLYATLMQDDEAYKNAKVEEKYGSFFVPVPGTDQLLRVPIPFELGYIFKALPEALVNTLANEEGGTEALKALQHIAKQTVPGLSSYFMPQAIKPALEVALDQSIFTGRDIESAKEKLVEPGYRYRDSTTELAKEVGEATGFSPVKMEYLIRGYTGSLGMAALAALSAPFGSSGPEGPTKRPSDIPVVGTLFQPTDASGIVDLVYERMNKARQVQETYESLIKKGRPEAAQQYLNENLDDFVLATLGGSFKQQMGEITKYEQAIRASSMTPEQKRAALDQARQAKISLAKAVREASGRTERQAAPA